MGFSFKLNLFHKSSKQSDCDTFSTDSTIVEEDHKKQSRVQAFLSAFSTEKFMNDPMRISNHPDVVGYYYDPMSCGHHPSSGYDLTNTGA